MNECDMWHPQEEGWCWTIILLSEQEIQSVGDKMLDRGTCPRDAGPPGPRLSSPGERERNAVMANRVAVNMLLFCSVSNSLSHTTLSNKVRGIFYKRTVSLVFIVSPLWFCMRADVYAYEYTTVEVDVITITKKKQHWFEVSSPKEAFFTGRVQNDRFCARLSNKSLLH